jgi:hypothetical protein
MMLYIITFAAYNAIYLASYDILHTLTVYDATHKLFLDPWLKFKKIKIKIKE